MAIEAHHAFETNGRALSQNPDSNRVAAFRAARRHSQIVKILKFFFPAVAVLSLGAFYLQSRVEISIGDQKASFDRIEVSSKYLKMVNPHLEGFNKKNGKYVVNAKSALQDIKNPDLIKLKQIDGKLTNVDQSWSAIVADNGLFNSKKEHLFLDTKVKLKTSSGMTAHLKNASISMPQKIISTKDPVLVEMEGSQVRAKNMTAHTAKRDIKFGGGVKVNIVGQAKQDNQQAETGNQPTVTRGLTTSIAISGNKPIDINSETLTVFDEKKIAHFKGNVVTTQESYQLLSDNLVVHYSGNAAVTSPNSQASQIKQIQAIENVRLKTNEGREASADKLDFDPAAETVAMSGNVVLVQDKNILKGNTLFAELKTGRSQIGPGGRVHGHFVREETGNTQKPKAPKNKVISVGGQQVNLTSQDGAPIDIESDMLTMDDTKGHAIFSGDVKTVHGKYRLNSQKLTVSYSNDSSTQVGQQKTNIKKLDARGKVLIITPDNQSATSDWAIFDVKSNIMTIGGNTVLTQNGNVLKGERLVINLNTGRSQFETEGPQQKGNRVRGLFMPSKKKKQNDKKQ